MGNTEAFFFHIRRGIVPLPFSVTRPIQPNCTQHARFQIDVRCRSFGSIERVSEYVMRLRLPLRKYN